MCGIAGIWAPRLATAERVARVHDMLHRMRHRGPSGIAVWSDDEITLDSFAAAAGTISYDVLTGLGPRVLRVYG